ncbi:unnamed protein product [Taenia asiatica]|uniref:Glutamate receptor n=1 Tax=Taenia asiatica TaxID=60517 RepID=A0A158R7M7_TAEAS|nr:unnamed protein product [Taenia asiatica]
MVNFTLKGVILEGRDVDQEEAYLKAIRESNQKLVELTSGEVSKVTLKLITKRIEGDNAFQSSAAACALISSGVVAIFCPDSRSAAHAAMRVCQQHAVPCLTAQWDANLGTNAAFNVTINLHPAVGDVGSTLASFLHEEQGWQELGLIYAHDDNLVKYKSLFSKFQGRLVVRKWNNTDLTHKYIIKYFMTTRSQSRFVVDIPVAETERFLKLIAEYNMTDQYYSYIFTDWDVQFVEPKIFTVDKGANFSTLSLMPMIPVNYDIAGELSGVHSTVEETPTYSRKSLTYYFLIQDSLYLLAYGISQLIEINGGIEQPSGLFCGSRKAWPYGHQLISLMKSVKDDDVMGLTGGVEFGSDGSRKNVNISILEMKKDGFTVYGYWNRRDKLVVTKEFSKTREEIQEELKGQTLRVATIEEIPFMMYKGPLGEVKSSDPRDWYGFCIDLLNECAEKLEFNYTVHPVPDGNYGTAKVINGHEVWDGIIGQLQFRKADLAVAMLTINHERERVIDFTTPFMNLGMSIIFKKPEQKKPDLFSFLRPLSPAVWGYVLIAYVGASMTLFFVARFSPYEWHNPHPCNAESEILENNFNMLNSLWFTIGCLMQKGSDIMPKATSTRTIAGFWGFFTLIIISSYTANLAAFLTVERMQAPIKDVKDLAKQTKIKYGTRKGGSSEDFFAKSNQSIYQRMWQFMSSNKGVMINNATEAIARVKRGGYAYILESTMNEYFTQRNCDLIQIGDNLDSKGYGIGFPQGSKYRDEFSEVILQLQESQALEQIRRYWWRNFSITEPCENLISKNTNTNSLGDEQIGGCFVMCLIGLGASILISLQEFLYKAYHRSKMTKRSFCEEAAREFRFSMARSSTRDFGAESALSLPPPPSRCAPSSKECRMAALAYAPCLPAADRLLASSNIDTAKNDQSSFTSRRPSILDMVRLLKRSPSMASPPDSNAVASEPLQNTGGTLEKRILY